MKFEGSGSKGTRVIERKMFFTLRVTVTLTFDLLDPKIQQVLQLNKSNHPMKFEGSSSKGTRVIERKRFSIFGSL